jgi:hypothetical protein
MLIQVCTSGLIPLPAGEPIAVIRQQAAGDSQRHIRSPLSSQRYHLHCLSEEDRDVVRAKQTLVI